MAKSKKTVKKQPARPAMKTKTKKAVVKLAKPAKSVKPTKPVKSAKPAAAAKRLSWLDADAKSPAIERYARQLGSFIDAMADGVVDAAEVKAQEKRLVALMKDVEPKLNNEMHEKVTQLLCELTAYDLMQVLHAMHVQRPKSVFQG